MATINPHTTRAAGTILTATIYNNDHENHIQNAEAINTELENLEGSSVTLNAANTWTAINTFTGTTGDSNIRVERTGTTINSHIQYKTDAGSIYAGQGSPNEFTVGNTTNLNSSTSKWFSTSAAGTTIYSSDAVGYGTLGNEFFAGRGSANMWAVGATRGLSSFTDRWWEVTATESLSRVGFKVGSSGSPNLDVPVSGIVSVGSALSVNGSVTSNGVFADNVVGGTVLLRPNGSGSSTGEVQVSSVGAVTANRFISTNIAVFSSNVTTVDGELRLRPRGGPDGAGTTNQTTLDGNGNLGVAGAITAGGSVTATTFNGSGSSLTGVVPTSRTLTAGTGMTGGGSLAADRTFNVDATVWRDANEPSSAQLEAILGNAYAGFSTTASAGTTSFPVGEKLLVEGGVGSSARNASKSVFLGTVNDTYYTFTSGGAQLSGTWRLKGTTPRTTNDNALVGRVS